MGKLVLELEENVISALARLAEGEGISVEDYAAHALRGSAQGEDNISTVLKSLDSNYRDTHDEITRMNLMLSRLNNSVTNDLFKDIDGFHVNLSKSLFAILVKLGGMPEDEAKEWINFNIRPIP